MKDKGQATFLLIAIIAFLGIGGFAGYKLFQKQEKKSLELDLAREAQELFTKISNDIKKIDVCTRTLNGHLKHSAITKIISPLGEEETALYEIGKQIGRLKIDRMDIRDKFEESESSSVNFIVHISNFNDTSKDSIGVKTFKHKVELKVDDCNNYFIAGTSMSEAELKCIAPLPEGIRGKVAEIIMKESATDTSVLLECRTCRYSGRKVIANCLN